MVKYLYNHLSMNLLSMFFDFNYHALQAAYDLYTWFSNFVVARVEYVAYCILHSLIWNTVEWHLI